MSSPGATVASDEDMPRTLDLSKISQRKSAFQLYKPSATVLTNLQRGNTQAALNKDICLSFHEKTAQGEITEEQVRNELTHVDQTDSKNFTALHWACYYGQYNAAQVLINCGANVNKEAPEKVTPLLLAAAGGHNEIVRLLLQKGADVNHMDIVGNNALMYAAAGNHPHTTKELLERLPDLTETNENGDDAYSLAIQNNCNLSQAVLENHISKMLTS
ncbi:DNA-binding protein RFXANK [Culicoides brevitarsis]|uniref:DNA-binding protein RFXANK n=1 Tax=Culicoides brevitarsis TaxID=469753 RepID=UPI00307BDDBA